MSATSIAEQHALAGAPPYITVNDRIALINASLEHARDPDAKEYDASLGFRTPHETLLCVLACDSKRNGFRWGDQAAIRRFCEHDLSYGHGKNMAARLKSVKDGTQGPLGSVSVIVCGRKKFVRWHEPFVGYKGPILLNFEMLLHELATNPDGQRIPSWYDADCIYRLE